MARNVVLAGAVGADQADQLAFVDPQVDAAHRADAAIGDLQAAQFE